MAQTLSQRLPPEWHLAGLWPFALLLVVSVLIGLHGERLTRVLILAILFAAGAAVGQRAADWLTLPLWPTVIFFGSLGGLCAFMVYRWVLAVLLAVVLAAACAAWSLGTHLQHEDISQLFSSIATVQPAEPSEPSAAAPAQVTPDTGNPLTNPLVLARYAEFLDSLYQRGISLRDTIANKPEAQKHLLVMMLAGTGVGLLAGLVLGRLAAILWTSVLGAAGTVGAFAKLAVWFQPECGTYLSDNRHYIFATAVVLAVLFAARQGLRRPSLAPVSVPEVAAPSDKS